MPADLLMLNDVGTLVVGEGVTLEVMPDPDRRVVAARRGNQTVCFDLDAAVYRGGVPARFARQLWARATGRVELAELRRALGMPEEGS